MRSTKKLLVVKFSATTSALYALIIHERYYRSIPWPIEWWLEATYVHTLLLSRWLLDTDEMWIRAWMCCWVDGGGWSAEMQPRLHLYYVIKAAIGEEETGPRNKKNKCYQSQLSVVRIPSSHSLIPVDRLSPTCMVCLQKAALKIQSNVQASAYSLNLLT